MANLPHCRHERARGGFTVQAEICWPDSAVRFPLDTLPKETHDGEWTPMRLAVVLLFTASVVFGQAASKPAAPPANHPAKAPATAAKAPAATVKAPATVAKVPAAAKPVPDMPAK